MKESVENLLTLDLPVLPPEASLPAFASIEGTDWMQFNDTMCKIIQDLNPHFWEDRIPIPVRFEL